MASQPIKRVRCEIYSRIVGYLSPVNRWNKGKLSEYNDRKEYSTLTMSDDK
jgi:anaerobic ribonucleoside-triphosphate reductase